MSSSASSSSASSSTASPYPPPEPARTKRKRDSLAKPDAKEDAEDPPITDDPPLSHAERRRQKRKEKHVEKEGTSVTTDPPKKKRKLADGTAANPAKSQRQNSVWVGNMLFKTTPEELRQVFDGVGEITRINMPMKPAKPPAKPENKGFAYVDFATKDAKILAITLSETPLHGRKLLIKDGDSFEGRPAPAAAGEGDAPGKTLSKSAQKILRAQTQPPAPTLFLGNLGFDTTEASIRELFEAHRQKDKGKAKAEGEEKVKVEDEVDKVKDEKDDWLRKVRMGTFEDSGLCKGFAFVDFATTEHATAALTNPRNHRLNGRELVVQYASADAVRRGASRPKLAPTTAPTTDGHSPKGRKTKHRPPPPIKTRRPSDSHRPKREKKDAADDKTDPKHRNHEAEESAPSDWRSEKGHRVWGDGDTVIDKRGRMRPRPGAALAQAKRQSAAILPTAGPTKKIVFQD